MDTLVSDAKAIFHAALRGVQPLLLLKHAETGLKEKAEACRRVVVVGAGKAAMAMAGAVEEELEGHIEVGLVVVPQGYRQTFPSSLRPPEIIEVVEAGHPVPDAAGVAVSQRVLALAASCTADDLLVVLVSGGGSALWTAPAEGLTLADVQATAQLLLQCGADIYQINTIRKHLSRIKGGHLAAAAHPATVLTLALSDVVGDDLSVIASGPTVPDRSTFREALLLLQQFDLWEKVPAAIRTHIRRGREQPALETPKPGHPAFATTKTILIGSNRNALISARSEALRLGYYVKIFTDRMTGEAWRVGVKQVRSALDTSYTGPQCLLWGGETTVKVQGDGKGGRNQELALAAALELDGRGCKVVFLSGGTDGRDGPTDAAGAWATHLTVAHARKKGLEPIDFLGNNDAYTFFDQMGALLRPGPTHTNVMDIQIALLGEAC